VAKITSIIMVFYLFVYNNIAKKARKEARVRALTLGNGKAVKGIDTVDELMRHKAMPVRKVHLKKGWRKSPLQNSESVEERRRRIQRGETLRETLKRMQADESLRDIMQTTSSGSSALDISVLRPELKEEEKPSSRKQGTQEEEEEEALELLSADSEDIGHPKESSVEVMLAVNEESKKLEEVHHIIDASPSKKGVQFQNIEIREYYWCIGDNPACSEGPPIQLSWKYKPRVRTYTVDDYETRRRPRRTADQLGIPEHTRIEMLLTAGYSIDELLLAELQKERDQLLRENTLGNLQFAPIYEIFGDIKSKYDVMNEKLEMKALAREKKKESKQNIVNDKSNEQKRAIDANEVGETPAQWGMTVTTLE